MELNKCSLCFVLLLFLFNSRVSQDAFLSHLLDFLYVYRISIDIDSDISNFAGNFLCCQEIEDRGNSSSRLANILNN